MVLVASGVSSGFGLSCFRCFSVALRFLYKWFCFNCFLVLASGFALALQSSS